MHYVSQIPSVSSLPSLHLEPVEQKVSQAADKVVELLVGFFKSSIFEAKEAAEKTPWPHGEKSQPLSMTGRLVAVVSEPFSRLVVSENSTKREVISRLFALALSPLFVVTGVIDATFGILTSMELLAYGRSPELASRNMQYLSGTEDSGALVYFSLLRVINPKAKADPELGFVRGLVERHMVPILDKQERPSGAFARSKVAATAVVATLSRLADASLGGSLGVLSMFTLGQITPLNSLAFGGLRGRGGIVKDLGSYTVRVLR